VLINQVSFNFLDFVVAKFRFNLILDVLFYENYENLLLLLVFYIGCNNYFYLLFLS